MFLILFPTHDGSFEYGVSDDAVLRKTTNSRKMKRKRRRIGDGGNNVDGQSKTRVAVYPILLPCLPLSDFKARLPCMGGILRLLL